MHNVITTVWADSPASKTIIEPGDILVRINGNIIADILDYKYYSYDSRVLLEVASNKKKIKLIDITKQEGEDIGLEFSLPLMDKEMSCCNKCIFCFIDQLPKGMRKTLYYKDDDVRQSLLEGNYVTLTNLKASDIKRLIKMGVSPINVSVHTLNPQLRQFMLGRRFKAGSDNNPINHIKTLAKAGTCLNCQIVCCPGINDGKELENTIKELIELGPAVNSVSVVPVGLTNHRDGLYELKTYDLESARQVISLVEGYAERCLKKRGSRVFYCADEFYMTARFAIPSNRFYEEYPQLQNGVGMMRLFINEFLSALKNTTYSIRESANNKIRSNEPALTVVTGVLAQPYIKKLINTAVKKYSTADKHNFLSRCNVIAVKNKFFGENITVSGLVTGKDIINQLKGKKLGKLILLPQNMLKYDENVFLDDITTDELSRALNIPVKVTETRGDIFLNILLEECNA